MRIVILLVVFVHYYLGIACNEAFVASAVDIAIYFVVTVDAYLGATIYRTLFATTKNISSAVFKAAVHPCAYSSAVNGEGDITVH